MAKQSKSTKRNIKSSLITNNDDETVLVPITVGAEKLSSPEEMVGEREQLQGMMTTLETLAVAEISTDRMFDYVELPTDMFGLKFRPTLGSDRDNLDWIPVNRHGVDMSYKHQLINPEFSDRNKNLVLNTMKDLESQGKLKVIFEIGVNRSRENSSTRVILDNKTQETIYIGIDLNPDNLDPIRNHSKNVYCLATNSSNYEEIMQYCASIGVTSFSMAHIDGLHSVGQLIDNDWKFAKNIEVGGVILGHDFAAHPGPNCLYWAIDEEVFEKKKHFSDFEDDWGMLSAKRLK